MRVTPRKQQPDIRIFTQNINDMDIVVTRHWFRWEGVGRLAGLLAFCLLFKNSVTDCGV